MNEEMNFKIQYQINIALIIIDLRSLLNLAIKQIVVEISNNTLST